MFPSHSTPNRFVPRGSFNHASNNQSPGRFSPQQSQDFHFSRNISPQNLYNGSNQYSPRNSTPTMCSPLNNPNRKYSPNPNSSFDSPQRQHFSPSPGRPYWNKQRSYNQSRTSSEYYSSGNSSFNDSSRGSPSYRKPRNNFKGADNFGKGYNIRDYVNPSMLENPWAELEKES